jgi:hypothetical protein
MKTIEKADNEVLRAQWFLAEEVLTTHASANKSQRVYGVEKHGVYGVENKSQRVYGVENHHSKSKA